MKTVELASDIVTGSSAFAAVVIVYVSSVGAAFGNFSKIEQKAVKAIFRRRALLGCAGVGMAALAAGGALIGKWASSNWLVATSAVLMIITLISGFLAAIKIALEID